VKSWRKVCATLLLVCLLVFCVGVLIQKNGTLYIAEQRDIEIAWDAVLGAEGYEVQTVQFFPLPVTPGEIIATNETSITLSRQRVAFYIIKVRAWRWNPDDPQQKEYSEWAVSDDAQYATVDGVPQAWYVFWAIEIPVPF